MAPQHEGLHNGISPGEQYNGIRNTNGISRLSLSRTRLLSAADTESSLSFGLGPLTNAEKFFNTSGSSEAGNTFTSSDSQLIPAWKHWRADKQGQEESWLGCNLDNMSR